MSTGYSDGIVRHDWTRAEVRALFALPFPELMFRAQSVHRAHFDPAEVQISTLLSIKTGGCPEDCAYCPQSAHYDTGVKAEKLMSLDAVLAEARAAKARGREPLLHGRGLARAEGSRPRQGLRHGRGRAGARARDLRDARHADGARRRGASRRPASTTTTTTSTPRRSTTARSSPRAPIRSGSIRSAHVRDAGIHVCCGGIVGMGESDDDRAGMIATLASLPAASGIGADQHAGAGRGHAARRRGAALDPLDFVRTIAVARITMPKSVVRLSAGREDMSDETQALCFLAGANSIFYGPKLLTTPNPGRDRDMRLLDRLGLRADGRR